MSTFLIKIWRCFKIAKQNNEVLINEQINFPEVMVIGPNGEKMGIKNISDALTLSKYGLFT